MPDGSWASLPIAERLDFLNRTNNGVVDNDIKARLDRHERFCVLRGRVSSVQSQGGKATVSFGSHQNGAALEYEAVVVAIGFNPTAQLNDLLVPNFVSESWLAEFDIERPVDEMFRLPIDGYNVHVPALAALAQGPGYSLLSCLGSVASRIVSAYLPYQTELDRDDAQRAEPLSF